MEESIAAFEAMDRRIGEDKRINVGALIEISQDGESSHYFIGPSAGGTEIEIEGTEVLVITLQSPLGSQLKGAKQGAKMKINLAGRKQLVEILNAF